jgi:hypothetical protein
MDHWISAGFLPEQGETEEAQDNNVSVEASDTKSTE